MENFDLKGWMKANNQGPYSMFEQFEDKKKKKLNEGIGGYVDMKPVNEMFEDSDDSPAHDTAKDWYFEYEAVGSLDDFKGKSVDEIEDVLNRFGEENASEVAPILHKMINSEDLDELQKPEKIYQDDEDEDENSFMNRDTRMMDLGGEQITNALHNLLDSGYGARDIKEFIYMALYEDYTQEDISGINADQEALLKGINDLLDDGFDTDDIEEFCDSVLENKDAMEKNYGSLEEDEIKNHNMLMKLGGNMMYKSIVKLIENGVSTETIIKMVPKLIKQYKSF